MMTETHKCPARIFTGARHDIGGHVCRVTARYHSDTDGLWYCKTHLPENVTARAAVADARHKAEQAAERQAETDAQARAHRLSKLLNRRVRAHARYDIRTARRTGTFDYVLTDVTEED